MQLRDHRKPRLNLDVPEMLERLQQAVFELAVSYQRRAIMEESPELSRNSRFLATYAAMIPNWQEAYETAERKHTQNVVAHGAELTDAARQAIQRCAIGESDLVRRLEGLQGALEARPSAKGDMISLRIRLQEVLNYLAERGFSLEASRQDGIAAGYDM